MKNNKTILFIILIATLVVGCKTQKTTHKPQTHTAPQIDICDITKKTYDAQPQFTTMNISKMSMSINYGEYSFSFKASLRIETNKIISISIQPALGIEMFRIEFTPTHFTIYDKLNRRYSKNDYEYIKLKWGVNVDYQAIEALFSHKIFTPETTNPTEICKSFKIENISEIASIVSNVNIGKYTQQFDINMNNNRLSMSGLQYEKQLVLAITYENLKYFGKILFPELVRLRTTMTDKNMSAILNIEKIEFNEPLSISPINTKRYSKVGLTELLKK